MGRWWPSRLLLGLLCAVVSAGLVGRTDGGVTSSFVRKPAKAVDMPIDSDVFRVPPGYNAPQQNHICCNFLDLNSGLNWLSSLGLKVHITQGNHDGSAMIISWVTEEEEPGSSKVLYGTDRDQLDFNSEGKYTRYKFYDYTSGYIHHCTLRHLKVIRIIMFYCSFLFFFFWICMTDVEFDSHAFLQHDTKYYYAVGIGHTIRKFWFTTPPEVGPDVPYTFGLIGDLGQSHDSNVTLTHYESNPKAQTVLFVGDLSYADKYPNHDNVRWDTWGRFVERSTAYHPWIWTAGNHEIDFAPEIVSRTLTHTHRYHVPYRSSGSTAPF
ncbi:hypothetical protein B296_00000300 [Ensete ventricosum]|uniref:Purple acid phosphatase n=1 Tax=Ensete ventricosum TaxID=4639 RepID=A0A427AP61_ENSVE|nr:hypothetical protein B296_00000300 [Ensete ventricosum]